MLETWCLNFTSRPFFLFNFCLNWAIYFSNVRCSSIIIPRYLVWFLGIIFWPLRQKLRCLVICFEWDFRKELMYKILVSSAKWCTYENIIALLRLLIYIRNIRGPNVESWGMPNSILESSDCLLLTVVNCCLFVK